MKKKYLAYNILLAIILLILCASCEKGIPEPTYVDAIFTMNPDGSDITHIIDGYAENVQFTPDGTRIIMNKGNSGIWSVKNDGTDLMNLTSKQVGNELPSLSPDSAKIAFSTGDIYIMNIDGTDLQNLTNTSDVQEGYPHFSFNGNKIVYTTRQDSINSIYIMDTSGANKRKIISNSTKYYLYSYPIFNVNGSTIFYKYAGLPGGLYSINVDGTNNTLLYEGYVGYTFPSISTDGTKIVFNVSNDIFIMNGDGTDIKELTEGGSPMISPSGEKIVYTDFRDVKVINNDGTGLDILDEGWDPYFSSNNEKLVYIKEREIKKILNKGIVY